MDSRTALLAHSPEAERCWDEESEQRRVGICTVKPAPTRPPSPRLADGTVLVEDEELIRALLAT
jgi:hypothetical protein